MQMHDTRVPREFRKKYDITQNNFKNTLLRFLIVSAIGFLVVVFVTLIFETTPDPTRMPWPYLFVIVSFNLLSEGNIIINRVLDHKLPWFFSIRKRIRQQVIYSLLWTGTLVAAGLIAIPAYYTTFDHNLKPFLLLTIFGFIFVLFFNHLLIIRSFFLNWRESVLENEVLKQAKLKSDYKVLQNQLNPHFLFNSLSVLISEIHYNPERAIEFTQKLAEVYRYILQHPNDLTVTLRQEMEFVENYLFLHKIRMGDSVEIDIQIKPAHLDLRLPPFSMYVLVENAIKHNRASEKSPLLIEICSLANGEIKVTNNIQQKKNVTSTGTGLDNNMKRYGMLSDEQPRLEVTDEEFAVVLPLFKDF